MKAEAGAPASPDAVRIERVETRRLEMPLRAPFETSFGAVDRKCFLLFQVFAADGSFGLGECVADDDPFYLPETNGTVLHVARDFLIPSLRGVSLDSPGIATALFARVRGHRMAKAAIEMAIFDLFARRAGEPLWKRLGGDGAKKRIEAGVSIGLQKDETALLEKVGREVRAGYRRIKIKIKPGRDVELVRAIRREFPDVRLMVDANSAYSLADAPALARLDEFGLMMIEQPLQWDDIVDHATLQKTLRTPVCLDESIGSVDDARRALDLDAARVVNVKVGRVGGFASARAIAAHCLGRSIPVWCGGMLESGVGRLANVHAQTLPGFSLPGDTSASARYFEEDLVDPPVTVSPAGQIEVPTGPGLGHDIVWPRIERATRSREVFRL
jgi:O-succinylbenzoate synthase